MAVGEYQWAKIQVQKHLLVPIPQNPATQDENKTLIWGQYEQLCTIYNTYSRYERTYKRFVFVSILGLPAVQLQDVNFM